MICTGKNPDSNTGLQAGKPSIPEQERIRTYDVQHIEIDVSFDRHEKKVIGNVETKIKPLKDKFKDFEVDAVGFNIIIWTGTIMT